MDWIQDETRRFKKRPYFKDTEINFECENMVVECFRDRGKPLFTPPLDTDALNVLLEKHAADVDLYADLAAKEGPDVEGVTEFSKGRRPKISIDKRLSETPALINRLRSTMAHELFHARFHAILWELHWMSKTKKVRCLTNQIIIAGKTDWYEWQAAYGSGAILMPKSAVVSQCRSLVLPEGCSEASLEGTAVIQNIAQSFQVSQDTARIRLCQLGVLKASPRACTQN